MTEPVLVTKPTGPNSSRVIKFGAFGLALILGLFFGPKLLGGGGGGGKPEDLSFGNGSTTTTTVLAPSGGEAGHSDTASLGSFGGRDPFTPLVDTSASTTESTIPPVSTDTTLPVATGDTTGGLVTGGDTTVTTAPPRPTHRLSLLEVYTRPDGSPGARVRVDDSVMETAVGQDFGGSYRTVSLDVPNGCGVFLFGDVRISLCERQEAQT